MEPTLRLEIFPADLDVTVDFYERLGFEVVGRSAGPPRYASLRLGDIRLGAAESDPVSRELRAVPAGAELVVEVDDVRTTRDTIVGAGIELADDLTLRPWGLTDLRLTDPDGYYWRFTDRRH
ncbi:VOC family protein [Phycicoccus sp.]|uniref:VOC family protein n=1 Tax=Phycicoccus sp. TaxID=1902410 RepID=UPI002B8E95B9|nr:VOC family protein [Phycicoccus sp.]HMM95578.1 VOC family protein [Phycicoccus sp.]